LAEYGLRLALLVLLGGGQAHEVDAHDRAGDGDLANAVGVEFVTHDVAPESWRTSRGVKRKFGGLARGSSDAAGKSSARQSSSAARMAASSMVVPMKTSSWRRSPHGICQWRFMISPKAA